MENNTLLYWIQDWFLSNCDGDWEHRQNFTITTIDNPGWEVIIYLEGTRLENEKFVAIKEELSEHNWWHCSVKGDGNFTAYCGPKNLVNVLEIFHNWAENAEDDA